MKRIWLFASAACAVSLVGTPLAAGAQVRSVGSAAVAPTRVLAAPQQRRLPGTVRAPSPPVSNLAGAQGGATKNAIYGTIVQINGNTVTLRVRNGKLRVIDASSAFAAGTVSAPLFIGKIVIAEGLTRTDGVLSAARLSRLTRLTDSNPDR